jgi:hypothetical protein
MAAPLHFAMNDTSWDSSGLILGGQGDLYYRPVWEALDALGYPYTVDRQPRSHAVNVYLCNRDRYQRVAARQEVASVHTSHGIADKRYRDNVKTSTFTHMVVPGPAFTRKIEASGGRRVTRWRNRFADSLTFRGRRIVELGYPKLDPVFNDQIDGTDVWSMDGRTRVLYAPTHGGGSEAHRYGNRRAPGARATSWWNRDLILSAFDSDEFEVVLAPHPRHSPGHCGTLSQYVEAQVVIPDGGSSIHEALVLGKPIVLPSWMTRQRNIQRGASCRAGTLEQEVYTLPVGLHASSLEELPVLVRQAVADGLSETDLRYAESIIPSPLRGCGGKSWADFLVSLADGTYGSPVMPPRRTRPAQPSARTFQANKKKTRSES